MESRAFKKIKIARVPNPIFDLQTPDEFQKSVRVEFLFTEFVYWHYFCGNLSKRPVSVQTWISQEQTKVCMSHSTLSGPLSTQQSHYFPSHWFTLVPKSLVTTVHITFKVTGLHYSKSLVHNDISFKITGSRYFAHHWFTLLSKSLVHVGSQVTGSHYFPSAWFTMTLVSKSLVHVTFKVIGSH